MAEIIDLTQSRRKKFFHCRDLVKLTPKFSLVKPRVENIKETIIKDKEKK